MSTQKATGGKVIFALTPNNFNGDKKKYKQWKTTVQKYISAYEEDVGEIREEVSKVSGKGTFTEG
jgi:hypothetical protein